MKKYFYIALFLLLSFEALNIYFIIPLPGSQRNNTIVFAYFLYSCRWYFRFLFGSMLFFSLLHIKHEKRKWLPLITLSIAGILVYVFNFMMTAESMFHVPRHVAMLDQIKNKVPRKSIVIGITNGAEARAYPIRFLVFHHQVYDRLGHEPVLITYCSVCRTGRAYRPIVNGRAETFRLVGMDHFNAMIEDKTSKSWWRQVTGEAIAGPLKGSLLPELPSFQMELDKWIDLYPNTTIMQPDDHYLSGYDSLARFEQGLSGNSLTGTHDGSWQNKSWVLGIIINKQAKAYDWKKIKKEKIIRDQLGDTSFVIVLGNDEQSFAAYEVEPNDEITIKNDIIIINNISYNMAGASLNNPNHRLKQIQVYQEFWHSWQTFHPDTLRD